MKPLYPPPHWSPEITAAETIISILQMRRMRLKEEEAPGPGNTVSLLHGVGRGLPLCPGQRRNVKAQFAIVGRVRAQPLFFLFWKASV